jgi:hypothetical protein
MPTTTIAAAAIAAAAIAAAAPIATGVASAVTTIIETAVMMTRVRARIPPAAAAAVAAAAVAATGVALRSARPPRFAMSLGHGPNERHDDTDREQTENEENKALHDEFPPLESVNCPFAFRTQPVRWGIQASGR